MAEISSTPVKPTLFTGAFHELERLTKKLYLFAWIELANSAPKMQGIERHLHIHNRYKAFKTTGEKRKKTKGCVCLLGHSVGAHCSVGERESRGVHNSSQIDARELSTGEDK